MRGNLNLLVSPFNASFKNEYVFLMFYTTLLWVPRRTRELGTLEQVLYSQGTQCYSFQLEQSAYWPGIFTWNIDLEYWPGISTWNIDLEYWPGNLTWNINLEYWPGILTWKLDLETWPGILTWNNKTYVRFYSRSQSC